MLGPFWAIAWQVLGMICARAAGAMPIKASARAIAASPLTGSTFRMQDLPLGKNTVH
jgi:hypothetical protein